MRLMLEKGEGLADSPFIAVSQLNNGQLEKAYQAAGGTNATPSLLILISTSPGAQDAWQDAIIGARSPVRLTPIKKAAR